MSFWLIDRLTNWPNNVITTITPLPSLVISLTLHQFKNTEYELVDTSARLAKVTLQAKALTDDKRRLEGDMAAMQSDLDDAINNQRAAEERAERLAAENARLAD